MPSRNGGTWSTSDLGAAAFAHMMGLEILGVEKPSSRFIFKFSDPEGRGESLQIAYLNSESRRFDSAVRSLKKLCYDDGSTRRRR